MVNWSNYKWTLLVILPIALIAFTAKTENKRKKWGFFGHQRINRISTFTLPQEMFGFYKEHIEFITEHAVDPDKRRYAVDGEAQRHYIDIDHYVNEAAGEDAFDIMPQKWSDAIEKFSEDTLQAYGIVPWHIEVMKFRLQKAFESQNVDMILKYSADIGHYIGDAHVPLHTTENYNGQMTNQKGIHGLWESRLVEINDENYNYFIGKAEYIPNMRSFIWESVKESHIAVDSVLKIERELTAEMDSDQKYSFERRGNSTIKVYSYEFSQEYHKRMNGMVERRLRKAILAVGSVWYTAWVDAGQPDLNKLQNTPPSEALLEDMKSIDDMFHSGTHKGRICD